jgi:hypothetical protein
MSNQEGPNSELKTQRVTHDLLPSGGILALRLARVNANRED